jgi:undecaprenyl diphosphate synthase
LPADVAEAMRKTEELTAKNESCRLNVCLCYNSKYEILNAFEKLSELYS